MYCFVIFFYDKIDEYWRFENSFIYVFYKCLSIEDFDNLEIFKRKFLYFFFD